MKTPYFIEKIDWSELRNQKRLLIEANDKIVNSEQKDAIEGILGLIDAVQDYAVDEIGMNAVDIYDFEQEEDREKETKEEKFAREQAAVIFQMHIEGSFLYENEEMSEEFIKSIVDDEQHASAIKNIIRHAILNDVENGTITSLEYNIDMYDYGYKIEDYCLEQFYKDKTKTLWVCPNCGSDNVDIKHWVNANTREIGTDCEEETGYCNDCETHDELIHQEMPYLKQVIGFQVVSDGLIADYDGELHPKMDGSFCVYNLSQAREMINDGKGAWKLITIWSGDIEEPTMMFEGNPRD